MHDAKAIRHAGVKYLPDGQSELLARSVALQQIADDFRMFPGINLGRPVTDQTGLSGRFDLVIVWSPELQSSAQSDTAGPSFLEALKDQLGLKLTQTKGPQRFLVIDHIEEPSPN